MWRVAVGDADELPDGLELTPSEQGLWEAYRGGTEYDLRSGDPAEDAVDGDREWGAERIVRARVITLLLINGPAPRAGRAAALRMRGALITGELDLSNSEITVLFEPQSRRLEAPLRLADCRAGTLILNGSSVPRMEAPRLVTAGNLSLSHCHLPQGLALQQAHIGMDFMLEQVRLGRGARGKALDADGLNVMQDLHAVRLEATGELALRGARIGGSAHLRGCPTQQSAGPSIQCPPARDRGNTHILPHSGCW